MATSTPTSSSSSSSSCFSSSFSGSSMPGTWCGYRIINSVSKLNPGDRSLCWLCYINQGLWQIVVDVLYTLCIFGRFVWSVLLANLPLLKLMRNRATINQQTNARNKQDVEQESTCVAYVQHTTQCNLFTHWWSEPRSNIVAYPVVITHWVIPTSQDVFPSKFCTKFHWRKKAFPGESKSGCQISHQFSSSCSVLHKVTSFFLKA